MGLQNNDKSYYLSCEQIPSSELRNLSLLSIFLSNSQMYRNINHNCETEKNIIRVIEKAYNLQQYILSPFAAYMFFKIYYS